MLTKTDKRTYSPRVDLTRAQEFAHGKYLEENLILTPGEKYIRYKDGLNDEKMAALVEKAIPGITAKHVARLRTSFFGNLPPGGSDAEAAPMARMWNAVNDLRARVEALENALTQPK